MITFELYGKLKQSKETDKFKPYQERKCDSGFTYKTLMFNAVCGDNRHMLTIKDGAYPDGFRPSDRKEQKIFSFSQGAQSDKGQPVEIAWKDRLLQSSIDKVATYRRFVVDLEYYDRRENLKNYLKKIEDGVILTDEELQSVGLTDASEVAEALEKSNKKRHEFITKWDYIEFIKKVLDSEKYVDSIFHIKGKFECEYSDKNKQWYINMVPDHIYLARPEMEPKSEGVTTLFYTKDAVDDLDLEEKHKYYVNAYTFEYNDARKKNIPCPFQLVIPDDLPRADGRSDDGGENRAKHLIEKFLVEDDSVKEYGVRFDILNGAQRVEITPDMLSEEQREDLEMGLIDMKDITRELGREVYGERIRENRYAGVARGYVTSGRKDTVYTSQDLEIPPLPQIGSATDGLFVDDDDDL